MTQYACLSVHKSVSSCILRRRSREVENHNYLSHASGFVSDPGFKEIIGHPYNKTQHSSLERIFNNVKYIQALLLIEE